MNEIIFSDVKQNTNVEMPENLVFGKTFTDHIFEMDFNPTDEWHKPTIKKYAEFSMSPAAAVLHYGQSIFEGMKAYKHNNGKIALFRPEKNFERMNRSAKRLCMPELDIFFVLHALKEIIKIDQKWIPTKPGHSLYIRPLMFANDPYIGVRPSEKYKFMIMLSPVGPYYPQGFKPVPILTTDKFVRAVRKGVGDCKTSGNYAASLLAQQEAIKEGYTQVLWLDAIEQKYIEEVGTMNIFIKMQDEIVTPMLTGTILPGVTRMSVIQILKDWGMNINERMIALEEVINIYNKKETLEIFGTGTAAIISSVSKLKFNDLIMQFDENNAGELGTKLYEEILGIQLGTREDKHNWMTFID